MKILVLKRLSCKTLATLMRTKAVCDTKLHLNYLFSLNIRVEKIMNDKYCLSQSEKCTCFFMKARSKSQKHRTYILKRNMILSNSPCMGTITYFLKTTHVENFILTLIVFETYIWNQKKSRLVTHITYLE